LADATSALAAQHLSVGTQTNQYSETVQAGSVISSDPASGTLLRRDAAVRLVVSKGVPPATVPRFVGMSVSDAQNLAKARHLTLATARQGQYSETVPKDSIVSQDVPAGRQVDRGTTVTVVVSLGPPLVQVPDVFRMDKNQAKKILQKAGFRVEFSEPFGVTPFDQVYSEDPAGGTMAPKGSTIHLGIV
jgi:serine/threonine-protein kinase